MILFLLLFAGVFGSIPYYTESEEISATNTTSMANKMIMEIEVHNPHKYLIEWIAEIQACNGGHSVGICLQKDGPITLNEQVWNPGPGWGVAFGFKVVELDAGNHTFAINYATGTDGSMVAIRRARIKLEEINL